MSIITKTITVNYKEIKKLREENLSKLRELEERYRVQTKKKRIRKLTPLKLLEVLYFTEKIKSFEKEFETFEEILN